MIVNISAINCDTQEGEAVEVTVASCTLYMYQEYISIGAGSILNVRGPRYNSVREQSTRAKI